MKTTKQIIAKLLIAYTFISNEMIAKRAKCDERSGSKRIGEMIRAGFPIKREKNHDGFTYYMVLGKDEPKFIELCKDSGLL